MNKEELLEHQKNVIPAAANEGLRDYFAAAALQGFCSGPDYGLPDDKKAGLTWIQSTAKYAYEMADAMLKERERGE